MKPPLLVALIALLVVGAAACGDDQDRVIDAGGVVVDAGPPDAAIDAQDICAVICECTVEYCDQELEACVAECATLRTETRQCRLDHCRYAVTNPQYHCPHATGLEQEGTPPECVR